MARSLCHACEAVSVSSVGVVSPDWFGNIEEGEGGIKLEHEVGESKLGGGLEIECGRVPETSCSAPKAELSEILTKGWGWDWLSSASEAGKSGILTNGEGRGCIFKVDNLPRISGSSRVLPHGSW